MEQFSFARLFKLIGDTVPSGEHEFLYSKMFYEFYDSTDKIDKAYAYTYNKVISGQMKPSKELRAFYSDETNLRHLRLDLEVSIMPMISQKCELCERIIYEIKATVPNIDDRDSLIDHYSPDERHISLFLAKCIVFAMNNVNITIDSSPDISSRINLPKIKPCKNFSGRKKELEKLHEMLQAHDKVFVYGIGGIGKSEFVKQYAQDNTKAYKNILFITYTNDMKTTVSDIDFINDRETSAEKRYTAHLEYLQLLKDDTLLIIDNFDVYPDDDEDFADIYDLGCRIIFTTRCHIGDEYAKFELSEMSVDDIMLIAEKMGINEPAETVYRLFTTVYCHTLCCDLIMRLLTKSGLTGDEILSHITETPASPGISDRIRSRGDNLTYTNHVKKLFALMNLSPEQQTALRYMCIIPEYGISDTYFKRLTALTDMNTVNELDEMGLITHSDKVLRIHQLIAEAVSSQLKPDMENMRSVIDGIIYEASHFGDNIQNRVRGMILALLTLQVIRLVQKSDADRYVYFLNIVCNFCETVDRYDIMGTLVNEISFCIDLVSDPSLKAVYYMSRAAIAGKDNDSRASIGYTAKAEGFIPKKLITEKDYNLTFNIYNNMFHFCLDVRDFHTAKRYREKCQNILDIYNPELISVIAFYMNNTELYHKMGSHDKAMLYGIKLAELAEPLRGTAEYYTALDIAASMAQMNGNTLLATYYRNRIGNEMGMLMLANSDMRENHQDALEKCFRI